MQNAACFPVTVELDEAGKPVHALNQITKVRLADGREVAIVDWTWRPLYSTIDTFSGWTNLEIRAFTYSAGDQISWSNGGTVRETATLVHTNISSASEMDALEEFLVYGMCVEVYRCLQNTGASTIDFNGSGLPGPLPQVWHVAMLQAATILELEVSQKAYQQASTGWFAAGFGAYGTGVDDTNEFMFGNNGHPSREAVDMYPVPVHIGGTEKYNVILHNPLGRAINYVSATNGALSNIVIRLRINLMGLHKRPSA